MKLTIYRDIVLNMVNSRTRQYIDETPILNVASN